MTLTIFLLIVAAVFSLPIGLFSAYLLSTPRARALAILGGLIGDAVVAGGIFYYISAAHIWVDALSYWFGALFACSVGVMAGALVTNFLVSISSRPTTTSSNEY